MKLFDQETTRRALPFERLIPALRDAFRAPCHVPLRHVHRIGGEDDPVMTTLIMPAWIEGGFMGIKTVNIAPRNREIGKPGLHSTYLLSDASTGEPLALMDGDEITSRRTAAASALAASFLARKDATDLLIVGAGRVASLLADAYAAVRTISRVRVWDISSDMATRLADDLNKRGYNAEVAGDLAAAAAAADIISCATLATEPLVRGEWLQAGSHLDLIGSFAPEMREADDDAFKGVRLYIDTEEALQKSGELLGPMSRGVFAPKDVVGTLEALCQGTCPIRQSRDERTVFKAVGTALEDLAAATLVFKNTEAK